VTSGFLREIAVNYALGGHYAANSDNFLPTLRDSLSVPSSRIKNQVLMIVTCLKIRILRSFLFARQ